MMKQREQIKWKIDSHWIHDFKFTLPLVLSHWARANDVPVIKFVVVIYDRRNAMQNIHVYARVCSCSHRCDCFGRMNDWGFSENFHKIRVVCCLSFLFFLVFLSLIQFGGKHLRRMKQRSKAIVCMFNWFFDMAAFLSHISHQNCMHSSKPNDMSHKIVHFTQKKICWWNAHDFW